MQQKAEYETRLAGGGKDHDKGGKGARRKGKKGKDDKGKADGGKDGSDAAGGGAAPENGE